MQLGIRTPKILQDKAQFAGKAQGIRYAHGADPGCSIGKNCNAGLGDFEGSLRASREAAICCVVILEKDMPFPADGALHMTASRHAESLLHYRTLHLLPEMREFRCER